MKRFFLDPATAISAGASVLSGLGSIAGGQAAGDQGGAQAHFFDEQIKSTRLQELRGKADLSNEQSGADARAKAVSAAQGGDIDFGIVSGIAGKYAAQYTRIGQDANEQVRQLTARASYARQSGEEARTAGTLKGIGQIASGGYSLYNGVNGKGDDKGGGKGGSGVGAGPLGGGNNAASSTNSIWNLWGAFS